MPRRHYWPRSHAQTPDVGVHCSGFGLVRLAETYDSILLLHPASDYVFGQLTCMLADEHDRASRGLVQRQGLDHGRRVECGTTASATVSQPE